MIEGLAKLAVRNIFRRGKKSWITVVGVFIGIAAVVSLVSLGQGLETAITQEFDDLGADNVFVTGEIDDESVDVVKQVQGVDDAAGYYSSSETVSFEGESAEVNVYGVDLSNADLIFSGMGWSIEEGRQLRNTDQSSILVGPSVGDKYGSEPDIRSQLGLEDNNFRVIGRFSAGDPQAQNAVITSLDRAREIYGDDDELSQIVVKIQPGFTQEEVQNDVEESLRRDRGLEEGDENFDTSTPQDILESLTNVLGVVQGIVVGLASIALLVGGIGIMNTMYMAINERTQEIGVLKAVGATKKQIRILFLLESGLIGLIGGLIGVLIGIGISELAVYGVTEYSDVVITRGYTPGLVIGALMFSTLLGLFSGYLPARKASEMDPADALRYE